MSRIEEDEPEAIIQLRRWKDELIAFVRDNVLGQVRQNIWTSSVWWRIGFLRIDSVDFLSFLAPTGGL